MMLQLVLRDRSYKVWVILYHVRLTTIKLPHLPVASSPTLRERKSIR
jgi:hypothetical protein